MKKLLIIQKDEAYFLSETLQVLEKNKSILKDYDLTVLVEEKSMEALNRSHTPLIKGITFDESFVKSQRYSLSVNLSLNETTWNFHGDIQSEHKVGFYRKNGELVVDDLWSSYLLTLKAKAPYLSFHLQDIYKNILGIKSFTTRNKTHQTPKRIAYGTSATQFFSAQEQDNFLTELMKSYPGITLKDVSEIDLVEDVSECLYIGPATLPALNLAEAGARCIFLTSAFQGFNLLPAEGDHVLLSTRGSLMRAGALLKFIDNDLKNRSQNECPFSIYTIDNTVSQCAYLKSHNQSDDNYPFYQSHFVLWTFLLNLTEVDLEIVKCTASQVELLKTQLEVLTKFIRLHDYAMSSIDTIHSEVKQNSANGGIIDGHIKNLQDIEKISDQIAASHSLLRPFLDFYRIRRGQNFGNTLLEQSQNSFLTYAEEHQALKALEELFSVTLRKNEVNI